MIAGKRQRLALRLWRRRAFLSVVCWAWYALRNARWLRENPDKTSDDVGHCAGAGDAPGSDCWAISRLACRLNVELPAFDLPFGPGPGLFVGLMVAIAVLC